MRPWMQDRVAERVHIQISTDLSHEACHRSDLLARTLLAHHHSEEPTKPAADVGKGFCSTGERGGERCHTTAAVMWYARETEAALASVKASHPPFRFSGIRARASVQTHSLLEPRAGDRAPQHGLEIPSDTWQYFR